MFGLLVGDTETFWLNMTNTGLGAVVLICLAAVAYSVVHELAQRRAKRIRLSKELDRDMHELVASYQADGRILSDPLLGPTMADGGKERR